MEEERVIFAREHGRAMGAWVEVEQHLWNTAAHCFRPVDRPVFGIGFAAISGLHPKLQFANAAIIRKLQEHGLTQFVEQWEVLSDRIKTQAGTRNNLAHWQVGEFEKNPTSGRRVALCPWINVKRRDKTAPPGNAMCIMELVKARLEFVALSVALENYLTATAHLPDKFPKPLEKTAKPPTLRQLRVELHTDLGHPHASAKERRAAESAANAEASLRDEKRS